MYNTFGDSMRLLTKKKVFYKGQKFSENEWMSEVCSFNKNKNGQYYIKNYFAELGKKEILNIFIKNIKKHTFLGLILPCTLFLTLFLISTFFAVLEQKKGKFGFVGKENSIIFLFFISFIFLLLGIILFFRVTYKKEKCYLSKKSGQNRYVFISYKEFCDIYTYLKEEE